MPATTVTATLRNQFGDALPNVSFTADADGVQTQGFTDANGNATADASSTADITFDQPSLLAALGDLLGRPAVPADPGNAALTFAHEPMSVLLEPGEQMDVVVVARADLTVSPDADIEGTLRIEGTGLGVFQEGDNVRIAIQANDGSVTAAFVDPPAAGIPINLPTLTDWQLPNGYIVQAADTAGSLSQRFLGAPGLFAALSDHDPVAGEVLTLPDEAVPGWVALAAEPLPPLPASKTWFTVTPNDILSALYDASGPEDSLQQLIEAVAAPPPLDPDPAAVVADRVETILAFLTLPSAEIVAETATSGSPFEGDGLDGLVG